MAWLLSACCNQSCVCLQIRVSADTQEHDLGFKLRQAQDFVEKNFRVKLEVKFTRWRSSDGTAKLRELVDRCSEWSTVTAPQVHTVPADVWQPCTCSQLHLIANSLVAMCMCLDTFPCNCMRLSIQSGFRSIDLVCARQCLMCDGYALQVNEKLRRNTTAVYLTPKLTDSSPSSEGIQSRPPGHQQSGQQQMQALAP